LGALQDQLANLLETITSEAIDIYEPIALDWGKLQQFYAVVASASTNLLQSGLKSAGDQYETGIYQAVTPSIMAIVYFAQADWGQCGQNGSALGYTPLHTGQEGYNGDLCDRFKAIGVNLSDVINRNGGWSNLPTWRCVSTRFGTSCRKTG
jgi:hypothetical protein